MHKPKEVHWKATLRILAYIKGFPGRGLLYKENGYLRIKAYLDSSYARDKGDMKSTSGYCPYVEGNLVT